MCINDRSFLVWGQQCELIIADISLTLAVQLCSRGKAVVAGVIGGCWRRVGGLILGVGKMRYVFVEALMIIFIDDHAICDALLIVGDASLRRRRSAKHGSWTPK